MSEQNPNISVHITDSETGAETDMIIGSSGEQVRSGDALDEESQGLVDFMSALFAAHEDDPLDDDEEESDGA